MLLAQSGVQFEDKKVNGEEWFGQEKPALGPLANLPYLKDGEQVIFESNAICFYLAEKFGLHGDCLLEKAKVQQAASFFRDWKSTWTRMCYSDNFDKLKETWEQNLPSVLKRSAALLGEQEFFCNNKLSWADFEAYELFYVYQCMDDKCLEEFPTLKAFVERIENLPKIKEFIASEGYVARPINAPQYAKFH